MITSIDFNNYNSLSDFDLVIVDMKDIPTVNEKVEYQNGYTIKTGIYDIIKLPITFRTRKLNSIIYNQSNILDWLTDIKDNKLHFSFMENEYYIVKNVEIEKITRDFSRYNTIELTFILEPFKYKHEGVVVIDNNPTDIYYESSIPGQCNIKIFGSGNIQLTINDETIQINNVDEYVELDSKLLLCLNKDKESKTRDMLGNFLVLSQGKNTIQWTGDVSKIEILPRTAYK